MNNKVIGRRLRQLRHKNKLTIPELSLLSGVGEEYIKKFEQGNT